MTTKTKKGGATKKLFVFGCQVLEGQYNTSHLFRVRRNDTIIIDKLKVTSLKKYKTDVNVVEEGLECGIAFSNLKLTLEEGDIIEGYLEVEQEEARFDKSPGLKKTF